jgi:peptidoglycan hydrolase CwlO-like protein
MAPRHTTHKSFASARDAIVLAIMLSFGFATQAQAGLNTTKADIEVAKKSHSETETKIEELEKQVVSLRKQFDSAQAKAIAAQARKEATEKDLAQSASDITKKTTLQTELDTKARQTQENRDKL